MQRWGVKGIKVDFMQRDDQAIVDFYWRTAQEAAKRHLLVDFHGAHKPAGLDRAWPWADGPNATRDARDYLKTSRTVARADRVELRLAPGGGFVARLRPASGP